MKKYLSVVLLSLILLQTARAAPFDFIFNCPTNTAPASVTTVADGLRTLAGAEWVQVRLVGGDAHVNYGGEANTNHPQMQGGATWMFSRSVNPMKQPLGCRCASSTNTAFHVWGEK